MTLLNGIQVTDRERDLLFLYLCSIDEKHSVLSPPSIHLDPGYRLSLKLDCHYRDNPLTSMHLMIDVHRDIHVTSYSDVYALIVEDCNAYTRRDND